MEQIMEDLVFILTKSTFDTIIREILLEIKVLYDTKAFYLFLTNFEMQSLYIAKISNNFWQKQVLSALI